MSNIVNIEIRSSGGPALQGIIQGLTQSAVQGLTQIGMAAAKAATDYLSDAISKASDLAETVSKNRTIFGDASNELVAWAENAPKALGMTKAAALDATGTLGNMFRQLGIGTEEARKLSQANVQLATDFASFHNADPTEVLEAITAAYRGEYDALQRYVPVINAAKVEQEALAMSHKATAKELTDQDKALAVNALMMKNAGDAAGDFSRTQESAANQARIASASMEDLKTKIGEQLLPAWTSLLNFINTSVIPALMTAAYWIKDQLGVAVEWLKAKWQEWEPTIMPILMQARDLIIQLYENAIVPLLRYLDENREQLKNLAVTWGVVIGAIIAASVAVTTITVVMFAVLIPALVAVQVTIYRLVQAWWDVVQNIWSAIQAVIGFFINMRDRLAGIFSGMFDGIKEAFRSSINWVISRWNNLSFTLPSAEIFGQRVGGGSIDTPNIGMLARGGIASGMAIVGERGRELVNLPNGSTVIPNGQTERILARQRSSSVSGVIMKFEGDIDTAFATYVQKLVRTGQIQLTVVS